MNRWVYLAQFAGTDPRLTPSEGVAKMSIYESPTKIIIILRKAKYNKTRALSRGRSWVWAWAWVRGSQLGFGAEAGSRLHDK